jgi:ParB-like nuclease family protein
MTQYEYEIHWYAQLFPELPADDYEKLKEDIRVNGQLTPIVINRKSNSDQTLLDGRHRMRVCRELSVTPWTVQFHDMRHVRPEMSEVDFIDSVNLRRRHMSDDQRVMLAVQRSEGLEKEAQQNSKRGTKLPLGENTKRSRAVISQQEKVTENKVREAQELEKANPEAAKEVTQGKTSMKDARKKAGLKKEKRSPKRKPTNKGNVTVLPPQDALPAFLPSTVPPDREGAQWLHLMIRTFELNYKNWDPGAVRDCLDTIPREGDVALLAPLLLLRDWIAAVLHEGDRAKWYTEHESFLDESQSEAENHVN